MGRIIRLIRIIGARLHIIYQFPDNILGYPVEILFGKIVFSADSQRIVGIAHHQSPGNVIFVGYDSAAVFQISGNAAVANRRQVTGSACNLTVKIGVPVQAVGRRAVHADGFAVTGFALTDVHTGPRLNHICLGRGQYYGNILCPLVAGRGLGFMQGVGAEGQSLHHIRGSIAHPLILKRPRTVQQLQGGAGERTAGFIHFGYAYGSVSFCRPGSQAADGPQARNRQQEGQGKGQKSSGSGTSAAGFCEHMLKHLVPPWY